MEFLFDYGLFLAKVATVVVAIVTLLIVAKSVKGAQHEAGEIEVTDLNKKHRETIEQLEHHLFDKAMLKARDKEEKKRDKKKQKAQEAEAKQASKSGDIRPSRKPRTFVLSFTGSIDAKEVAALREEVTAILAVAVAGDEVLLRLETWCMVMVWPLLNWIA